MSGASDPGRAPGAVLVSACLLGLCCRYDGGSCPDDGVRKRARRERLVPFCPEQLGGLSTPRPPARLVGGDGVDVLEGRAWVQDADGRDVTAAFLRGAEQALLLARAVGADRAWLKDLSPSCGVARVHGEGGTTRPGMGVAAAALARSGLKVSRPPKGRCTR
ncbi:MAG: DUF523 domain-containing protein [Acetobacteraceae bacterium]|nr:DUF523 domain-containing protein [Acetobacteraceae bacterium]